MTIRHTVALALLGWYLIMPPALDPRTQESGVFVDLSAPLSEWDRAATFRSKAACEVARHDRLCSVIKDADENAREARAIADESVELNRHRPFDSEKADDLLFRVLVAMLREQVEQREIASQCVASDGQR